MAELTPMPSWMVAYCISRVFGPQQRVREQNTMARYEIHRNDGNAKALIAYLEAHGASVARLDTPLDAAVGFLGVTVLVEIKTLKGKLRPKQADFLATWRGACRVIRSEADCDALLQDMRRRVA